MDERERTGGWGQTDSDRTALSSTFTACVSGIETRNGERGDGAKHLGRNATLQLSQKGRAQSLEHTANPSKITAVPPHQPLNC